MSACLSQVRVFERLCKYIAIKNFNPTTIHLDSTLWLYKSSRRGNIAMASRKWQWGQKSRNRRMTQLYKYTTKIGGGGGGQTGKVDIIGHHR